MHKHTLNKIIRLRNSGKTWAQIAKSVKYSTQTCKHYAFKADPTLRRSYKKAPKVTLVECNTPMVSINKLWGDKLVAVLLGSKDVSLRDKLVLATEWLNNAGE